MCLRRGESERGGRDDCMTSRQTADGSSIEASTRTDRRVTSGLNCCLEVCDAFQVKRSGLLRSIVGLRTYGDLSTVYNSVFFLVYRITAYIMTISTVSSSIHARIGDANDDCHGDGQKIRVLASAIHIFQVNRSRLSRSVVGLQARGDPSTELVSSKYCMLLLLFFIICTHTYTFSRLS